MFNKLASVNWTSKSDLRSTAKCDQIYNNVPCELQSKDADKHELLSNKQFCVCWTSKSDLGSTAKCVQILTMLKNEFRTENASRMNFCLSNYSLFVEQPSQT